MYSGSHSKVHFSWSFTSSPRFALPFLNRRGQGDANQLQGRCLFLQNDFEGALRAVLRAQVGRSPKMGNQSTACGEL